MSSNVSRPIRFIFCKMLFVSPLIYLCSLSTLLLSHAAPSIASRTETNADRLRRGLPPRSPKHLWSGATPPTRAQAGKRAPPPAVTFNGGASYSFNVIAGKTYRFTAQGASGGYVQTGRQQNNGDYSLHFSGGQGGLVIMDVPVNANRTFYAAVGGAARPQTSAAAGGGGGTFVYFSSQTINAATKDNSQLILAAGGGSGANEMGGGTDATTVAGSGQGGTSGTMSGGGGSGWLRPGSSGSLSQGGMNAPSWQGGGTGGYGGGGGENGYTYVGNTRIPSQSGGGAGYTGGRGSSFDENGGDGSLGGSNFAIGGDQGTNVIGSINVISNTVRTTSGDGQLIVEEV